MGSKLAWRGRNERMLDRYYDGDTPLPDVITNARVDARLQDADVARRLHPGARQWSMPSPIGWRSPASTRGDKAVDSALWDVLAGQPDRFRGATRSHLVSHLRPRRSASSGPT